MSSNSPESQPVRHDAYFLDTVIFQVERHLFKVPRYKFEQGSEKFKRMYHILATDTENDESPPIVLDGVTSHEFESFLMALYPLDPRTSMELNENQWLSALRLSTKWEFGSMRKHAMVQLSPMLQGRDPLQKLCMERQYKVAPWLRSAYRALVERDARISMVEVEQIGLDTAFRLMCLREDRARGNFKFDRDSLLLEVQSVFKEEFAGTDDFIDDDGDRIPAMPTTSSARNSKNRSSKKQRATRDDDEQHDWRYA